VNYYEIRSLTPVNDVDSAKVETIIESIKAHGWTGAPILVCADAGTLITGSHRLAALKALARDFEYDGDALDCDVAEDVSDIVEAWCEANDSTIDDIRFDSLAEVFAGTRIEAYADEIEEW
jgi:hypothetical protein